MEFVILHEADVQWDDFVSRYTDLLFFSTSWAQVLEKGLGGSARFLMLKDGDKILCAMPVVELNYYGVRLLYTGLPYAGLVGDRAYFDQFITGMFEATRSADIVYITPFSSEADAVYSMSFDRETEAVTRIDLRNKSFQDIQSDFKSPAKRNIRKGARMNLEILCTSDHQSFRVAHDLYCQSMRRNKAIIRYSADWFDTLYHELARQGQAVVYSAKYQGVPVSAMVIVKSGGGFHFLHIGASTEHLHLRANDCVVNSVIEDAVSEEKEYVDFMSSDPNDIGLIRWKEKFGGKTELINKYCRVNRPMKYFLWQSAKKIYPKLKIFQAPRAKREC